MISPQHHHQIPITSALYQYPIPIITILIPLVPPIFVELQPPSNGYHGQNSRPRARTPRSTSGRPGLGPEDPWGSCPKSTGESWGNYDDPHGSSPETGGFWLSIFGHFLRTFRQVSGEKDILLKSHIKGVLRNLKADAEKAVNFRKEGLVQPRRYHIHAELSVGWEFSNMNITLAESFRSLRFRAVPIPLWMIGY